MRAAIQFMVCMLSFGLTLKCQTWEVKWLREINIKRDKSWDGFHQGLSQAAYPINAGLPLMIFSAGLIQKDKTMQRHGMVMAGSTLTALLVANVIKPAVNRPRPYVTWPEIQNVEWEATSSFPSSHTSTSFALAMSASLRFPKWYIVAPSFIYAGAVSYSRMHLGVHYPSDIFGGILVGCGSAWLNHWLSKKWFEKSNPSTKSLNDKNPFNE